MRVGYVAVVGRPNVGKSTLLNHMVGQKVSITSRKPQTTRHRVLGIKTTEEAQLIFVDTPGIHNADHRPMNRLMNETAFQSMLGVDVVLWVVEALKWLPDDEKVLARLSDLQCPVLLVINKIDQLPRKEALLPFIEEIAEKYSFAGILPISALKFNQLDHLEQEVSRYLPEGELVFPNDWVTDKSMRFLVSEIVREKIIRQLGEELPYEIAVEIEQFKEDDRLADIGAVIFVQREGQKRIVIGAKGARLKSIGSSARVDIEKLLDKKVMLRLWVKVKEGWTDNERFVVDVALSNGPIISGLTVEADLAVETEEGDEQVLSAEDVVTDVVTLLDAEQVLEPNKDPS